MPNNFFPALESRGALPAFYQYQQNDRQNQLVGIQQQQQALAAQEQQARFQQQQQAQARREQFNALIPQLAGLSPMEAQAAGPAIQGAANGAPPAQQPQQPVDQNALLARAYQLDPEGTQKFLDIRSERTKAYQQQQQSQAAEAVREAQFVLSSKSPKALMKAYFPDRVDAINQAGHDFEAMTDDDVKAAAQHILERSAPRAGLDPMKLAGEGFTLGKDQQRFDARGNVIASGPESTAAEKDPQDKNFKRANVLRDELNAQTKDIATVQSSYQNILATAQTPSAAGDISLLTAYMKLLDPGSTVREGEFATAANASGVPAKIRGQWNKLVNGERLAPETRADFVSQAGQIFKTQKQRSDKLRDKYSKIATRAGIDPQDVLGDDLLSGVQVPGGAPAQIKSDADYNALPSGTEFIAPDGSHRKKP